jgi:hypothetical protein
MTDLGYANAVSDGFPSTFPRQTQFGSTFA